MGKLTIGAIAKSTGVAVETIRFYEREGLLAVPARKGSGYRQYTADAIEQLRFIRRAKALGFSLKEIKELLALRAGTDIPCAEFRKQAQQKVTAIEAKIEALQRMKETLTRLTEQCCGSQHPQECTALDTVDLNK